jgi:hypothetical protein
MRKRSGPSGRMWRNCFMILMMNNYS